MNRDKTKQKSNLHVIEGSGTADAAKRMATAPLANLRANPVTRLCERFATRPQSDDGSVLRLLHIVGTNGDYGIEGELKGKSPHKSVHLHHGTEPHKLAGYLHKEFAKARLLGVRDQLSDPAQYLYDELLYASSTAWANAAKIVELDPYTDPVTNTPQRAFKVEEKSFSLDFPPRHPEQGVTYLPLILEGHMQGHLTREKENLKQKMAKHAADYTPELAARDRYILSELVLPTITFYPHTRESFLSDPKTYTEVDRFLLHVMNEKRDMAQLKNGTQARYPAGRPTPASRPSAQILPLRARPSGPESPT